MKNYDKDYPLIIDPLILSYSTYLGGSEDDRGFGIAVDISGNAYVTGITVSANFPTYKAYQTDQNGWDAFVTKFSSNGSLIYSTYLGGSYDDYGYGIAVDISGNAYVVGNTYSNDFPTKNAYQESNKGGDVFLTKLSSSGNSLIYSTYIGGSSEDYGYGVVVDSSGNAYLTGATTSTDFPITLNAYQEHQGGTDVFLVRLDTTQSGANSLIYSTYLGGSSDDYGKGIAVDSSENIYVTGYTNSANFPSQNTYGGNIDAFVTKLNASGLIYSIYLGGSSDDYGYGIVVDLSGHAYLTGYTYSTNFPITQNAFQSYQGSVDAFVTKLDPKGNSLIYSTYLGGSSIDHGYSIAVDSLGYVYVTGLTMSNNFPIKNAFQNYLAGEDAFVTKLDTTHSGANSLIYSTYLGGSDSDRGNGIAVDAQWNTYVTGYTLSTDFFTKNAYQYDQGGIDVFVTKLSFEQPIVVVRPNGGQKWNAGSRYLIKWEAPLNSYKFNLRYSTDNKTTWTNIATVFASNRCTSDGTKYTCTYGWTIPAQDGRKPQSFVRVVALNSSNQTIGTDDSDKAFVIEVLKLTSPNGGETLKVGSTHTITWETYALTKTVARVQLQYSTNGGQSWINIKTLTGNPGQYNWTVPNTPSTNCRVRVILLDSAGAEIARDVSDRVFTIQQ